MQGGGRGVGPGGGSIIRGNGLGTSASSTTLTHLLCSEDGLIPCLEMLFQSGLKSSRIPMRKVRVFAFLKTRTCIYPTTHESFVTPNFTISLSLAIWLRASCLRERFHLEAKPRVICHVLKHISYPTYSPSLPLPTTGLRLGRFWESQESYRDVCGFGGSSRARSACWTRGTADRPTVSLQSRQSDRGHDIHWQRRQIPTAYVHWG